MLVTSKNIKRFTCLNNCMISSTAHIYNLFIFLLDNIIVIIFVVVIVHIVIIVKLNDIRCDINWNWFICSGIISKLTMIITSKSKKLIIISAYCCMTTTTKNLFNLFSLKLICNIDRYIWINCVTIAKLTMFIPSKRINSFIT